MMTTVTISDELRKKLKRLAAKYDTSQADIIEKALEILEKLEKGQETFPDAKNKSKNILPIDDVRQQQVQKMLAETRAEFEQKYPDLARSHKHLRQNLHLLEDATIGHWELPFEE